MNKYASKQKILKPIATAKLYMIHFYIDTFTWSYIYTDMMYDFLSYVESFFLHVVCSK